MSNDKTILNQVREEVAKAIFGQGKVIDQILCTLLAGGHCLLEGPPGVGKTLIARSFSKVLDLSFNRMQFTPDLMPSDILGVSIIDPKSQSFVFKKGPIFSDIVLADELNRAPARTQAAMLEAMEERQISIDSITHSLPEDFMVIATQNPFEYEGTYGLPEAQLDRFLMKIKVNYPSKEQARTMLSKDLQVTPDTLMKRDILHELRRSTQNVFVDDKILDYVNNLIHITREHPEIVVGASPRASLMLIRAAKGWAFINGREFVIPEDIREMANPVLAHRLKLSPDAEIDGLTPENILEKLFQKLEVPRS